MLQALITLIGYTVERTNLQPTITHTIHTIIKQSTYKKTMVYMVQQYFLYPTWFPDEKFGFFAVFLFISLPNCVTCMVHIGQPNSVRTRKDANLFI